MSLPLVRRNITTDDTFDDDNSLLSSPSSSSPMDNSNDDYSVVQIMAYRWLLAIVFLFLICQWWIPNNTGINDAIHWGDENFFAMVNEEEEHFQMSRVEHFMNGWID